MESLVPDTPAQVPVTLEAGGPAGSANLPTGGERPRPRPQRANPLLVLSLLLNIVLVASLAFLLGRLTAPVRAPATVPNGEAAQGTLPTPPQLAVSDRQNVGRSDATNDFVVTVDAIQRRGDGTRLWLSVENRRPEPVQFMAGATAALVGPDGTVYRVDPFQGQHPFWGAIPPGGRASGWLVFEPIPAEVASLTLIVRDVWSLKVNPWNVVITFPVS